MSEQGATAALAGQVTSLAYVDQPTRVRDLLPCVPPPQVVDVAWYPPVDMWGRHDRWIEYTGSQSSCGELRPCSPRGGGTACSYLLDGCLISDDQIESGRPDGTAKTNRQAGRALSHGLPPWKTDRGRGAEAGGRPSHYTCWSHQGSTAKRWPATTCSPTAGTFPYQHEHTASTSV